MKLLLVVIYCFTRVYFTSANTQFISIDFVKSSNDVKRLPRFWTNTGFAPPQPIEKVNDYFESTDVNLNLEIIGSMPNNGIRSVRIHWLLNLLSIIDYDKNKIPVYDFERLDKFFEKLINEYNLLPTIEFMTTLKFDQLSRRVWKNFAYQIVTRYIKKYGKSNIAKWKFEAWNEPDLSMYNTLNFTLNEYLEYLHGIKDGLRAAEQEFSIDKKLKFRGPSGLFKDYRKHKLCWSVLEKCNKNISNDCPIDIITFHRKGDGNDANEIIDGTLELLNEFSNKFSNLSALKYSNTEADPIKRWSEPRDFQSDMRYASILVETIFQHWKAIFDGRMKNLDSISHDNSFLNFYPNIFTQRTLLARFQMNNSVPAHVQFIQKPVFSALALISNVGMFASSFHKHKKFSYVISTNNKTQTEKFYSCIVILTHVNNKKYSNKTRNYDIEIFNLQSSRDDLWYFVEALDNKNTNPSMIYEKYNKPPFPNFDILQMMRKSQNPKILEQPARVLNVKIFLNAQLMEPFVISIRICSRNLGVLKSVHNLRIRKINSEEIALFWTDSFYRSRCIKTYEIFFKYQNGERYVQIETGHIPFLYHQFYHTIPGCFKVRSKDIFNRVSKFSKETCF